MMMGIYPPGTNNYLITDEQQERAVPPIDFDFSPWIKELGNYALPEQTAVFPIQAINRTLDYMLSTAANAMCPKLKTAEDAHKAAYATWFNWIINNSTLDPTIKNDYLSSAPEAFCNFGQWSWIESVPLTSNIEAETRQVCLDMFSKKAELRSNFFKDHVGGITTNTLR